MAISSNAKKLSISLLLIVVALLSGCASYVQEGKKNANKLHQPNQLPLKKRTLSWDQQRQWFSLIGKTYLNQPNENGGRSEILSTRFIDGTYEFIFRNHTKDGSHVDNIEVGEWGISEGIYFTIFKGWIKHGKFQRADSRDPYNRDVYKVITLNDNVFIYDSMDGKVRYTTKQVNDDFILKKPKSL